VKVNQLSCCADSCQNHKNGYCLLSSIEVSGMGAQSSTSTCCESFQPKSGEFTNAGVLESPYSDIKCDAEDCVYNSERCCCADYVDIAGHAASSSQDTVCSTFRTSNM